MTVKAKAFAAKMTPSEVAESVAFVLEASDPTISPDGGVFVNRVEVTLGSRTAGASIHYSLDGAEPTSTSPLYNGPFELGQTDLIVKAIAMHPSLMPSNLVESVAFTIKSSAPVLDPTHGSWTAEALIKVSTATQGAKVRCTVDGTQPTSSSWHTISPISITDTNTIVRCISTKSGLANSDVTSTTSPVIIQSMPPVLTPTSGAFTNQVSIVMSCKTAGCTMHYTTDGSTPSPSSPLYTAPVVVTTTATIVRCVSVADGKATSEISATEPIAILASAPHFTANGTVWGE